MMTREGSLNILWSANAIWCHTGYGVQGKYLLPRFAADGHKAFNLAWYGLEGGSIDVNVGGYPVTVLPNGHKNFGLDVIGYYVERYDIDLVISLQDIWVLPERYNELFDAPWACWFPVDHDPLPERVHKIAKHADWPMTYSKWGWELARDAGLMTEYIPHAVDTKVFHPGDKKAARVALGLPQDRYLVVMVAANKGFPSRKSYAEAFQAFRDFRDANPDLDPYLYAHCDFTSANQGLNLNEVARSCGIIEDVSFVNRQMYMTGIEDSTIADIYRAGDCMLLPSMTEGFGIPLIEAQACGCPVVTNDYGPMAELTVNGVTVEPGQPWWSPLGAWCITADIDNVAQGLHQVAHWDDEHRAEMAQAGIKHIRENYDWNVVYNRYWRPFLAKVEPEILDA